MPDTQNQTSNSQKTLLPPPSGDSKKAEKYIKQLIELLNQDKVQVVHTDLSHFDPSALEDHYRIDLSDYQVEISHSKNPNTSEDSFVLLFNNLKQVREGCSEKSILAYMYLDGPQFQGFKTVANAQLIRIKSISEEKRFNTAMDEIDEVLSTIDKEPAKPLAISTSDNNEILTNEQTLVQNDIQIEPQTSAVTPPASTLTNPEETTSWPPLNNQTLINQAENHSDPWQTTNPDSQNAHGFESLSSISNLSQPHPMDNYLSSNPPGEDQNSKTNEMSITPINPSTL